MKIVTIFWILLAVLCGGYGLLIRAIGSGTGFFLVWIALAVIFVGCSAAAQAGLWGIMPQFLRRVTLVLLCLILVLFTGIGGCIGSKMKGNRDWTISLFLGHRSMSVVQVQF